MSYAGAGLILLSPDATAILLVHDTRSKKWGFPKGHREKTDTSDLHTATREVWEETGLTTDDYTVYPDVFRISKGSQSYLFRYAVLRDESRKLNMRAGPSHEISGLQWVPIKTLLEATTVLDGNKYLRTWIADVAEQAPKKSVALFKALSTRLLPAHESVSACNVIACA